MNIILIGFMGTGKTVVGRVLALELNLKYLDTDELIVKSEKMSISEIFARKGEEYFRGAETTVVKTLRDHDGLVISTGGGLVLRPENVKILKEIGTVIWLQADPAVIFARIKDERHRPLLKVADPAAEIGKLLAKREPIYRQAADRIVNTSVLSISETVEEIVKCIS